MFDKLVIGKKETIGVDSNSITQMDFLSFLIGIRKLLNNELSFTFTCKKCSKNFDHKIDLEEEFEKDILDYEKKTVNYEKIDNADVLWKFELESYTMKNYLYYLYYLDRLRDFDGSNPELINEAAFVRPALYIKKIWRNGEEIEDWDEQMLVDKIKVLNILPNEVVLDPRVNVEFSPTSCLSNFIIDTFDEEKMFKKISNMRVKCPYCGEEYVGIFKFDDFFTF